MEMEREVERHYERTDLIERVLAGVQALGLDPGRLRPADLAPVDEFHIGGRAATEHLAGKLPFRRGQRLLDVGSGLGGPARFLAERFAAEVVGIDLTPAYVATARRLTELTDLAGRVAFEVGSALAMPFPDGAFDGAVTIHVAMNIADRPRLYGEVFRVLRPGAAFGSYDVMRGNDEALEFPVPWASGPAASHLTTPQETEGLLRDAGFEIVETEDRTAHAKAFFEAQLAAAAAAGGPPPLGLHLLTGDSHRQKFANMIAGLRRGAIAPGMIVARRPA